MIDLVEEALIEKITKAAKYDTDGPFKVRDKIRKLIRKHVKSKTKD